jgi:hypothetical protein
VTRKIKQKEDLLYAPILMLSLTLGITHQLHTHSDEKVLARVYGTKYTATVHGFGSSSLHYEL